MKPERIEQIYRQGAASEAALVTAIVDMEDAELLHLLRCARAWAELGEYIDGHLHRGARIIYVVDGIQATLDENDNPAHEGHGPDLLTATEAALAKAKEQP